jgi:transposase
MAEVIAQLTSENERLQARVAELEDQLAKAKKNSTNSSKPPSSDIVNPKPKKDETDNAGDGQKRKPGGQPGHQAHHRKPFEPEEIDVTWTYYYTGCPCCGGPLEETDELEKVLQQIELKSIAIEVQEHRRGCQHCSHCDRDFRAPWPEDLVAAGLAGPRLTALIGYLKSACHMSFSSIRKYLRDVVRVTISRGQLRKLVAKVADSLLSPYEQLLALLPHEDRLHVDETGHKDNGKRLWTWCFRASLYTVYKISPSRGSDVLLEAPGRGVQRRVGLRLFQRLPQVYAAE